MSERGLRPFVKVLGIVQDGGYPHVGCRKPCCELAREHRDLRRRVTALGLIDPRTGSCWLFEATPDIGDQIHVLLENGTTGSLAEPLLGTPLPPRNLAGIFITHAHLGHYLGLAFLGREALAADRIATYAMPRLRRFLETNAPWRMLVELGHIELRDLVAGDPVTDLVAEDSSADRVAGDPLPDAVDEESALGRTVRSFGNGGRAWVRLADDLHVAPFVVPHRGEFSETVGIRIRGPFETVVFLPDIDRWEEWGTSLAELVRGSSAVYLDGTFFTESELPGRNLAEIPHPPVTKTMQLLDELSIEERDRVRFLHLNHTNPLLRPDSLESRELHERGFRVAVEGEVVFL